MKNRLIAVIVLMMAATFSSPAAAQWRFDDTGTEARAYVIGAANTLMGFRCTSEPDARQQIMLDLQVVPSTTQPDAEEVAHFQIGTWTFDVETLPIGNLRSDGTQAYQSRFDYDHPVIQNLRRQIAGGSRVSFTRTFDFAAMSFNLRGSRVAMTQLDSACHRLWRGDTGGVAASGDWQVENDGQFHRAIVRGSGDTYFGLECLAGQPEQTRWVFQFRVSSPLVAQTQVVLELDGTRYPVFPETLAEMQLVDGIMPFLHIHQPVLHSPIVQRFHEGVTQISFLGSGSVLPAGFSGFGASEALDSVLEQCGHGTGAPTVNAQDPVPVSDPPPDWALAALESYVASVVQAQCTAGSIVELPENTFRVEGDRVFVRLGFADCDWQFRLNPYCGARLCAVWEYRYADGAFDLIGNTLR